jgi:hypothetical protein
MPEYREGFVRLLYSIILAQFIMIAILLGGFSSEYLSNVYFRIWVDNNFPQLGLLLTGQVDALLVGMAVGGTVLLIQRMKNEARTGQTTMTFTQPSSSTQTRELIPDHGTQAKARETPDEVLVELEKQDL